MGESGVQAQYRRYLYGGGEEHSVNGREDAAAALLGGGPWKKADEMASRFRDATHAPPASTSLAQENLSDSQDPGRAALRRDQTNDAF